MLNAIKVIRMFFLNLITIFWEQHRWNDHSVFPGALQLSASQMKILCSFNAQAAQCLWEAACWFSRLSVFVSTLTLPAQPFFNITDTIKGWRFILWFNGKLLTLRPNIWNVSIFNRELNHPPWLSATLWEPFWGLQLTLSIDFQPNINQWQSYRENRSLNAW